MQWEATRPARADETQRRVVYLEAMTADASNHHRQRVVLVVEQDALLRLYADQLLEHAGFEVLDAVDAGAPLRILANRPDVRVLFTEVRLRGDVDGLQLARMVHEQWPNVRLLITSTGQRTAAGEVADHGHFLPKPYLRHELIREIDTMVPEADARAIRQNVSNQKGRSDMCRE